MSEHAELWAPLWGIVGARVGVPQEESLRLSLCVLLMCPAPAALIPPSPHPGSSLVKTVTCCWDGLGVYFNQQNPTGYLLQPWLDGTSQRSDLMEGTGYLWLNDRTAVLQSRDHIAEVERS